MRRQRRRHKIELTKPKTVKKKSERLLLTSRYDPIRRNSDKGSHIANYHGWSQMNIGTSRWARARSVDKHCKNYLNCLANTRATRSNRSLGVVKLASEPIYHDQRDIYGGGLYNMWDAWAWIMWVPGSFSANITCLHPMAMVCALWGVSHTNCQWFPWLLTLFPLAVKEEHRLPKLVNKDI